MSGLAAGKITVEFAVLDYVDALRGNSFVIVRKCAQTRPVRDACVSHHIDDRRRVPQVVQLIQREKACSRKVRFLPENAVKFNRMANRFMNLQSQLATA